MFLLGTIWGVGYFWTVAWALWPARGTAAVVCAIVSVMIAAFLCWIAWRRRHRFADVMPENLRDTAYGRSWPNTERTKAKNQAKA